ncbi:MAG TPA: hypothetical protein VFQ39_13230, partial [Longimicrobium sp.]|nr:hypothetical protein [Longimicrobium sp.]
MIFRPLRRRRGISVLRPRLPIVTRLHLSTRLRDDGGRNRYVRAADASIRSPRRWRRRRSR